MDWAALIQNFGVSVVALVFLAWGAVRVARWGAPRFEKYVDRVFSGVEKISTFDGRIMAIEGRLDTLWEFQLRRAAVEVMQAGVGKMNSPLVITPEAKSWLVGLAADLRVFYRRLGRTLTESQLAEEIERRWGKEIVEKVCIPHGLFQGACLLIAMAVAKEGADAEDVRPEDAGTVVA